MKNSDMEKNCFNCGWSIDGGCNCTNEARCVDWDQWKPKLGRIIATESLEIIDNRREQFAFGFAKILLSKGDYDAILESLRLADFFIKELDK